MRNINAAGLKIIKDSEGLRLRAYKDAVGIPTIGYGHTKDVKMGDNITPIKAEELLREDLVWAQEAVEKMTPPKTTDNQFSALVSLVFNVGAGNIKASTLLKLLRRGDIKGAAAEFLRWNRAGGKILPGLVKRRKKEMELFLTI